MYICMKKNKQIAASEMEVASPKVKLLKTIVVSPDLNKHLKILAAQKGVTVKKLVEQVLRNVK